MRSAARPANRTFSRAARYEVTRARITSAAIESMSDVGMPFAPARPASGPVRPALPGRISRPAIVSGGRAEREHDGQRSDCPDLHAHETRRRGAWTLPARSKREAPVLRAG